MASPERRRSRKRIALEIAGALILALVVATLISTDGLASFGGSPSAETLARMRSSPRFAGDHFENEEPTVLMKVGAWQATRLWLFTGSPMRTPTCPLPIVTDSGPRLATPPASGLRVTWLGHSTALIEIDGQNVLTDPQWSERASPSRWIGPKRFHPPPLPLADLPRIDAVIVSHDHYDHLDMATVRALSTRGTVFHVPLGVGAHLEKWAVPARQIVEHDWWQRSKLGDEVELVATPARHFQGRGVPGRVGSLWSSWAIVGPKHRVYFSGDTGATEALREIATREGPFDLAMIEIGQYHWSWGDIHLGPIGALDAFAILNARRLLPIHWSTFELGLHAWSEPAETLFVEAEKRGAALLTPRLGEPVEPTLDPATTAWWRTLPPIAPACP